MRSKARMVEIRKIADTTYEWAVRFAKEYNFDSDLSCMCAIASGKLYLELRKAGIKSKIAVSKDSYGYDQHVFIIIDEYLIDLTVRQFNSKIRRYSFMKLNKINKEKHYWWTNYDIHPSHRQLVLRQENRDWPDYQTATLGKMKVKFDVEMVANESVHPKTQLT